MVELALLLPFLLLLLVATVEAGFALRDYLMVQSANREGVRLAVRTPPGEEYLDHFRDTEVPDVFTRINTAAGEGGLRTEDLSIILTHIYIAADDTPTYDVYTYPPGFSSANTRLGDITAITDENATKTARINATRQSAAYDPLANETVIVEVFYRHEALWSMGDLMGVGLGPFSGDWTMYATSSMRMVGTGRGD